MPFRVPNNNNSRMLPVNFERRVYPWCRGSSSTRGLTPHILQPRRRGLYAIRENRDRSATIKRLRQQSTGPFMAIGARTPVSSKVLERGVEILVQGVKRWLVLQTRKPFILWRDERLAKSLRHESTIDALGRILELARAEVLKCVDLSSYRGHQVACVAFCATLFPSGSPFSA